VSEENKAIVRRWFEEVWNRGREATIDELFPAEGVAHGLGDSESDAHGPTEFKTFAANIRGSIPDTHIRVEDILTEGDRVAVRVTLEGTHTGHGLGVPPTGRKISIQGIIILRMVDGQIAEAWNSYDQLGLLRQVGALPGLGGQDRFDSGCFLQVQSDETCVSLSLVASSEWLPSIRDEARYSLFLVGKIVCCRKRDLLRYQFIANIILDEPAQPKCDAPHHQGSKAEGKP
jgi:steroid delta-isomerase-like uncharacterized protein